MGTASASQASPGASGKPVAASLECHRMAAAARRVTRTTIADDPARYAIVSDDGVLADRDELLVYECDGFTIEKSVS